ncbi:nucleoside deaminase [Microbulbifer sp. GL-2]|uniref:nucleoside deaminase n=1 Tax=Microbulbifer sp. GL-2 TaxID=2591606 RepID=UPI0011633A76|nr:nucleoside deaminase [Microbulbifer sp. GL-2]BBM01981.1 tRNA-specific adenosine deaminase [Microbulbifer sp. GL-2]
MSKPEHEAFMQAAIDEARKGLAAGGIPIGCVLVRDGEIIGRGHNQRIQQDSVIKHAEMDALEKTGRLRAIEYQECTLYTTLSPCPMCSGAIRLYGIRNIVIGENTTFQGDELLLRSEGISLTILNNSDCINLMNEFIQQHPEIWHEDIGE